MVTGGWFILVLPTLYKQNFLVDYGDFGAAPLATCHGLRYLRELAKQPWAPAAAEWKILQTWCEGLLKVFFPTPEDGSLEKTHAATAGCYRLIEMRGEEMSPLVESSLFLEDARQSIMKVWYHYCEPYPGSIRCEFGGNQCCFGAHFCLRFSIRI
jgi:hypothetical protein